jgi:uncharacterized secreted protein with C-terminal beta-propeller domain
MRIAKKRHNPYIKLLMTATISLGLSGCLDLYGNSDKNNHGQVELKPVSTNSEFKAFITSRFTQLAIERESAYATDGVSEPVALSDAASSPVGASEVFSTTNTQVNGVDEGDVWKYDGEHFFVLQQARWDYEYEGCNIASLSVSSTASTNTASSEPMDFMPCYGQPTIEIPAQLRIVKNTQQTLATLDLAQMNPNEMYLHENSLVLLGNKNNPNNNWRNFQNWQNGQTQLRVLDISNVSSPTSTLTIKLDGTVVQSRRIGDELFLITRYTPNLPEIITYPDTLDQVELNKKIVAGMSVNDLLPNITINDLESPLVNVENCLITQGPQSQWGYPTLSTITRINIKNGEFSSRCMGGSLDGIYMSENNLYLFNTSYWEYVEDTQETDIVWNWSEGNTHLHKFALHDFNYEGSSLVAGTLGWKNPKFRLGELHDGSIAVVTTDGSRRNERHHLTVLNSHNGELNTLATLPNKQQPAAIGKPGEDIYSVRFMQNRAYIVTFQKVDPLYVIDLSNTNAPTIAGELEIPGFSDYLHPIGDDLLLGIGKDAKVGASGTTWYQGVKVSLFNVADIQNPTELGNILIGKRGSNTALSYEPHAFTGIQQDDQYRFAFPISVNNVVASGNVWRDPESQRYNWSHSGLYIFEIKDNQLMQAGAMITERNEGGQNWESWGRRRGLIQGNDIYHLSGKDLYHSDWSEPENMSDKF